jgi:hypothetical protein
MTECKNFLFACRIYGKNISGNQKIGITATQMAITALFDAKSFAATSGANNITKTEMAKTIKRRIRNEAFTYSSAFSLSPLARCSAIKLTEPDDIPTSASDEKIFTKLSAAENIPKSAKEKDLATIKVNRNPQNADNELPIKRTYVSLAVPEKTKYLSLL